MRKFIKIYCNFIFVYFILFLFSFFLFGCNNLSKNVYSNDEQNDLIEVTDTCNRTVKINQPVKKIIALSPSDCEILCELNVQDLIVGRGSYCNYPQEISEVKDFGSGPTINIETIASEKPDVVLMSKSGYTIEQVEALERAGVKVLVNEVNSFNQLYSYINELGLLTNKLSEANKLIFDMQSQLDSISKKVQKGNLPKVYFAISPFDSGCWTAGSNTFFDEICQALHFQNIFCDINGWNEVSIEQVFSRNPEYIICVYDNANINDVKSYFDNNLSLSNVSAIKNNNIICIENNEMTIPGPRVINAIKDLNEKINEQ